MPRRDRPRGRTRRYIGAIWEDRQYSSVAIAAAPDQPDRGRLIDFRLSDEKGLEAAVDYFEQLVAGENGEILWVTALRGTSCIAEACLVPREVENAPPETKAIASLAGTAWGDPESAAQMQLALAYQIDGRTCTIAAAPTSAVEELGARFRAYRKRVTSEAVALAELVRAAHPDAVQGDLTSILGILCTETNVSFVILENGEPQVVRQCDLGDTIRAQVAQRRPSNPGSTILETESESWSQDDFTPSWKSTRPEVDVATWNSAFLVELRDTLSLFKECGGHIADIGLVLVTGEAAERFELRGFLPTALGFDVEVQELEASRVVVSNDVDVARRVAESEAALAGALALLTAGRRDDGLAFAVDTSEAQTFGDAEVDPIARAKTHRTLLARFAALLLVATMAVLYVVARYVSATRGLEDVRQQLRVEERRAEELRVIAQEKAANEARYAHVKALLAAIDAIKMRQRTPAGLLADIQQLLPERAGLERVAFDGSWVTISGASEAASDADAFALSLQAASDRFAEVSPATAADSYTHAPPPGTGLGPEVRPLERFSIRARLVPHSSKAARP